jgi:hypothetical protein
MTMQFVIPFKLKLDVVIECPTRTDKTAAMTWQRYQMQSSLELEISRAEESFYPRTPYDALLLLSISRRENGRKIE